LRIVEDAPLAAMLLNRAAVSPPLAAKLLKREAASLPEMNIKLLMDKINT
jgi:hypothetical protein